MHTIARLVMNKNNRFFRKLSRVLIVAAIAIVAVLSLGFAMNRVKIGNGDFPIQGGNLSDSQPDDAAHNEEGTTGARNNSNKLPWGDGFPLAISDVPDSGLGSFNGKPMTLDDVRMLSAKGADLLFEDLQQYPGANASSSFGYYIMVYSVEGGYRLVVHSKKSGKPDRVSLESIWEDGGSGIDIRSNDVDAFLLEHPSQAAITEEDARDMAQEMLGLELAPVSWYILGDGRSDSDAVYANDLLCSIDKLDEPCWVLRVKSTAEWGGSYYAIGKKSGTLYIYDPEDNGKSLWYSLSSLSETDKIIAGPFDLPDCAAIISKEKLEFNSSDKKFAYQGNIISKDDGPDFGQVINSFAKQKENGNLFPGISTELELQFTDSIPQAITWYDIYVRDGGIAYSSLSKPRSVDEINAITTLPIGMNLAVTLDASINQPPSYKVIRIVCEYDDYTVEYNIFFDCLKLEGYLP